MMLCRWTSSEVGTTSESPMPWSEIGGLAEGTGAAATRLLASSATATPLTPPNPGEMGAFCKEVPIGIT
jgi:hypothetical protein